jgi:hypothetical protein
MSYFDDRNRALIDSIMESVDAGIEIIRQESGETLNDKPHERHRAMIDFVISMSMDESKSKNPSIQCARYVIPLATSLFLLLNLNQT